MRAVYCSNIEIMCTIEIGVAGGISPTVFLGIPGITAEGYCQDAPFLQS